MESARLRYIQNNQATLRADLYSGLQDSIRNGDVRQSGRMVVLPPTFTGCDRFMHNYYQNSLALVRKFGKPTFFITITCNLGWNEIKNQLKDGQVYHDRPDLICRVFNLKLMAILKDIENGIIGKVLALGYSIEFQKRGAPHAHMCVWIENFDPNPANIDNVICAELPSPTHPLHTRVKKFMVHGPCGSIDESKSCMKKEMENVTITILNHSHKKL